jgi:hypothetical protein
MKHVKLFLIFFIGIFVFTEIYPVVNQGDIPEGIYAALRTGNANALSKYFNPKIELTINDKDDIYSREQAGLILKDFFSNHVPNSFNVLHKGGKEGSKYAIGNLITSNNEFRVTILIKYTDNQPYIHQLRIEKENGR